MHFLWVVSCHSFLNPWATSSQSLLKTLGGHSRLSGRVSTMAQFLRQYSALFLVFTIGANVTALVLPQAQVHIFSYYLDFLGCWGPHSGKVGEAAAYDTSIHISTSSNSGHCTSSLLRHRGKQQQIVRVFGLLPLKWKTWMEFQPPGFKSCPFLAIVAIWRMNQQTEDLCFSPF